MNEKQMNFMYQFQSIRQYCDTPLLHYSIAAFVGECICSSLLFAYKQHI